MHACSRAHEYAWYNPPAHHLRHKEWSVLDRMHIVFVCGACGHVCVPAHHAVVIDMVPCPRAIRYEGSGCAECPVGKFKGTQGTELCTECTQGVSA